MYCIQIHSVLLGQRGALRRDKLRNEEDGHAISRSSKNFTANDESDYNTEEC